MALVETMNIITKLNYSVVQFARLHLKYVEKRMENRSLFHSNKHVRSLRKLNSNF